MKYKFAYSTNAYINFSLLEAIDRINKIGFDGVELLADVPHLQPLEIGNSEIKALKASLDRHSLNISNINANTSKCSGSILSTNPKVRKKRIDYIKKCLHIANTLGAKNISISVEPKDNSTSDEEAYSILIDSLKGILSYAEQFNVKVGIEYEPDFYIDNAGKLLNIIADINHSLLGANLDIGHSAVVGDDMDATIKRFGDKIWNIHLEDIKGGVHNHLIPGEGDVDFASLRSNLDKIGYSNFITLELYPYKDNPDSAGRRGLEYVKNIF